MTNPLHAALDAYLDTEHPVPHAILVQGPWGSGKTYAVNEYFAGREAPVRISLFGLKSVEDIQRRVREAAFPDGAGHLPSILGLAAASEGGGFLGNMFKTSAQKTMDFFADRMPTSRPFLIDDLERFEGDIGTAMGYLNLLSEEAGRKLILLANEEELRNRTQDWESRAEKLIGRRVTVPTDPGAVLDSLIAKRPADSPLHEHAVRHRDQILDAFNRTELGNFRSLAWAVENLEKVLRTLGQLEIDLPESYHAELADLVTAFTVEHRGGRIGVAHRDLLSGGKLTLFQYRLENEAAYTENAPESTSHGSIEEPFKTVEIFLDRHPATESNPPIDFGLLFELEASGSLALDETRRWLNGLGYGVASSPLDTLLNWPRLDKLALNEAIDSVRLWLDQAPSIHPEHLVSLALVAATLEDTGGCQITDGLPTDQWFRQQVYKCARQKRLIFDFVYPRLSDVVEEPDGLPAQIKQSVETVVRATTRALNYQHRKMALGHFHDMQKQFLLGDRYALDGLASPKNPTWSYTALNWLNAEAVAHKATSDPATMDHFLKILKSRASSSMQQRSREVSALSNLVALMRDRVAAWEAPLDKLHTMRLDDWARELGLDP